MSEPVKLDGSGEGGMASARAHSPPAEDRERGRHRAPRSSHLYALIPGLLIVGLSFKAGGFFPGTTALAVVATGLALVARVASSDRPFAGLSVPYVLGACALGLFTGWALISAAWSGAPGRAIVEYDRALLYLLTFVLLGAGGRTPGRLRWMVRAITAGAYVVCLCALITRLLPDVWEIAPSVPSQRLSFPLTYQNALGLLAALAFLLGFALTSDDREAPVGRVLAAAVLPVLGVTLMLTFSRGAIAAGAIGLVALIVVGRPRALLSGLLVAVPTVAVAVVAAYRADLLAVDGPTTAAATAQGHDVAVVVVICTVVAGLVRGALLYIDPRVARIRLALPFRRHRAQWAAGALGLAVVVALAGSRTDVIGRQYDRFAAGDRVRVGPDNRTRFTSSGDNGRLVHWRVSLEAFAEQPLRGHGGGTYGLDWDRGGAKFQAEDGHSLYVETLGEYGLVGLVLISMVVLLILGGFLRRARGPDRVIGGALFGAGLAWALRAGLDWDWEMPAVTLWFFAAGGLALAASEPSAGDARQASRGSGHTMPARFAVALGCLLLLSLPVSVYRSEGPLSDSARAFARGDCVQTVDHALDSIAALGVRHEPYVLMGYCDVRLGRHRLAVRAMRSAVDRDPANWETHYGLALVRAAAGLDPRPEARIARRLKPRTRLPVDALRLFDTSDPQKWRRRARAARLPAD